MAAPTIPTLDQIAADLDHAACVAYRTYHLEQGIPFAPWNSMTQEDRQPWIKAVAASWAVIDPERYGQFVEIIRQGWAHVQSLLRAYGSTLSTLAESSRGGHVPTGS